MPLDSSGSHLRQSHPRNRLVSAVGRCPVFPRLESEQGFGVVLDDIQFLLLGQALVFEH